MGTFTSKPPKSDPYAPQNQPVNDQSNPTQTPKSPLAPLPNPKQSPFFPFYTPSPAYPFKKSPSTESAPTHSTPTPLRFFKKPFPPPSPAKHIRAVLRRLEQGKKKKKASIPEEGEGESEDATGVDFDKRFGFSKEFTSRLEIGEEVGRGHFGYTCSA